MLPAKRCLIETAPQVLESGGVDLSAEGIGVSRIQHVVRFWPKRAVHSNAPGTPEPT